MRWYLPIGLIFFLAGCGFTPQGDAARAFVTTAGAQAFDEGLVNAEWFVCTAASIGSIKRAYGASTERAQQYAAFCLSTDAEQELIAVPEG